MSFLFSNVHYFKRKYFFTVDYRNADNILSVDFFINKKFIQFFTSDSKRYFNFPYVKFPIHFYAIQCAEVGGLQISSANRKSANLRTYFFRFSKLLQMCQFADLCFADRIFFSICRFANCGIKTSA